LFVEDDISEEQFTIYSPSDNLITKNNSIHFWWEDIIGATHYNLQIVKNKFDSAAILVVDTNITKNKFLHTLDNGNFEWRIKACNQSSSSEYFYYSLNITQDENISSDVIVLSNPLNYDTTNNVLINFNWLFLPDANEYVFEIWTPNYSGSCVLSTTIDTNSFNYSLNEGSYEWGVRGINEYYSTEFSKRFLFIDTCQPSKPTLIAPINTAAIINSQISFDWQRYNDSGSSIHDSIYFYSDTTGTNLLFKSKCTFSYYIDSLGVGDFYWQVQSFDKAGNASPKSEIWKVTTF
jgi:hypothetical protein